MNKPQTLLAPMLWAAAMLAAARYAPPSFFAQILLPVLAATSLLSRPRACLTRRAAP